MKYNTDQILELYEKEAIKHGVEGTATIQDIRTRNLEIEALASYMKDGIKMLEVGCGNGYVAQALIQKFQIELDAFDFTPALVEIAKKRKIVEAKGTVNFFQADVLEYLKEDSYDCIFTERVLQNLVDWPSQQIGLKNIRHNLKKGGIFIMEECFMSGLNNLNAARNELGLEPIDESWHNVYFHDDKVLTYMDSLGMQLLDKNCFLSGYYFGSRVLMPALMPKDMKVTSNSILNDYFSCLKPAGDFSPMKIYVFCKT